MYELQGQLTNTCPCGVTMACFLGTGPQCGSVKRWWSLVGGQGAGALPLEGTKELLKDPT
jgi:hypothetical protein